MYRTLYYIKCLRTTFFFVKNEKEKFVCILIRWRCQVAEIFTNLGQGFVYRTSQISWSLMAWWQGNCSNSVDLFLWKISVAEPGWLTWRTICQLAIIMMTSSMETFSALLALCAGNSPVTGEFPSQKPVTRSFDGFFDLHMNKRLGKQSWGWWFETPSRSLSRHCN